ncbi:MAG: TonB-dependent receptor [Alteraurantiacibacter sp.]
MKLSCKGLRTASVSALAISLAGLAAPAIAQETGAQEQQGDSSSGPPEIIVTAQYRGQRLQDTPIAITAVSGEQLEARGQTSVYQIAAQAPNVTLAPAGAAGGPTLIGYIRGVGQANLNPTFEPGVGLYVDDVYYSTLVGSVLDLLDLDRVEVLRGPQGTLAGKNSIGGAIKLFSREPVGDGSGSLEAGFGSFSAMTVRGSADFTVVPDQLFARISTAASKSDGYVERVDYACSHPGSNVPSFVNGTDCSLGSEGGTQHIGGRLALRWTPSSDFELNLSADYVDQQDEPPANALIAVANTALSVGIDTDNNINTGEVGSFFGLFPYLSGYDVSWNAPGALGACRFITSGPRSCDPNSPNNPYMNYSTYTDPRAAGTGGIGASGYTPFSAKPQQTLESYGLSAAAELQLGDSLALKSITAYRHYTSSFSDDADATPLPGDVLVQNYTHRQFSQELRLGGNLGTLLDYTVGAFYFDQQTDTVSRVDLPAAGIDFISGPDSIPATTWALFAHGEVHLTDRLDATFGVRFTDDSKDYLFGRSNPDGSPVCTGGYNCSLIGLDGQVAQFRDKHIDYRAALSYRWSPSFMTYAQVSTGIKGGGINPTPYYVAQILPFGPETQTAFETGFKSQAFDRRVRLNGAVFYSQYRDIQLGLLECSAQAGAGFGFPCLLTANAGSANVKGFELEAQVQPDSHLNIDGSLSYLDFAYSDIDPLSGIPITAVTPFTPEWKASAGIQYRVDLPGAGSVTPRLDMDYQSVVFTNASNTPLSQIEGRILLNGQITWRSDEDDWQVSLEVRNITDRLYYLSISDFSTIGNGYASGQPGMPRTWQMRIKRSF